MYLKNLRTQQFRNHTDSTFEFGNRTNVLLGENGQGKTNIIEAITYLCITKSFFAHNDSHIVKFGADLFEIEGTIISERADEKKIRVAYSTKQNEKIYLINKHRIEPFSSVIGKFPLVICSPEYAPITSSGPSERRKFVDFVISQSNQSYFQRLLEFRKILKNRNVILFDGKQQRQDISGMLEPWNEQLIDQGSYIIFSRNRFVKEFREFMQPAYSELVNVAEIPTIEYQSLDNMEESTGEEEIRELMRKQLKLKSGIERKFGTTLVGPHRDELVFKLNSLDLRTFASQGQHKTFLVALKIGEFFYLKERCNETPILLLDDIFSELDKERAKRLLSFVESLNQTFITSTNPNLFEDRVITGENSRLFYIHNGSVVERQTFAA